MFYWEKIPDLGKDWAHYSSFMYFYRGTNGLVDTIFLWAWRGGKGGKIPDDVRKHTFLFTCNAWNCSEHTSYDIPCDTLSLYSADDLYQF